MIADIDAPEPAEEKINAYLAAHAGDIGHAYIGAYALDRIRHGCKGRKDAPFKTIALTNRFIDSGAVYADKDAVDNYVGSMQAITKKIFATFEKTYLTCR